MTNTPDGHIFIKPQELPYLSRAPDDGRSIVVSPYYDVDAKRFYAYSPRPGGMILVLQPTDYIHGTYLAQAPANKDRDCRLPFSETIIQHFSFSDAFQALTDAEKDLINGLGSLHKYFVLLDHANENRDFSAGLTMSTEVEYAFGNHRSFFDRLQRIISIVRKQYRPNSAELPDSFGRIEGKTDEELATNYRLPGPLICFYRGRKDVFLRLRHIRDNIFHHGHSPDTIFRLRNGFAIAIDDRLGRELGHFNLWPDTLLKANRLGSVLAIFAFLIRDMFDAMNHLGDTFLACFHDPPAPIASGYQVFLRSSLSKHLASLDKYQQQHWFDPEVVLGTKHGDDSNEQ